MTPLILLLYVTWRRVLTMQHSGNLSILMQEYVWGNIQVLMLNQAPQVFLEGEDRLLCSWACGHHAWTVCLFCAFSSCSFPFSSPLNTFELFITSLSYTYWHRVKHSHFSENYFLSKYLSLIIAHFQLPTRHLSMYTLLVSVSVLRFTPSALILSLICKYMCGSQSTILSVIHKMPFAVPF